jgi:hypothetical protein
LDFLELVEFQRKGELKIAEDMIKGDEPPTKKLSKKKPASKKAAKKAAEKKPSPKPRQFTYSIPRR